MSVSFNKINLIYTETIKELINNGYHIVLDPSIFNNYENSYYNSMDQTYTILQNQSDKSHYYVVSFIKYKAFIKELFNNKDTLLNKFYSNATVNVMTVNFEKFVYEDTKELDHNGSKPTFHINIFEKKFYSFSKYKDLDAPVFAEDLDELYKIYMKRCNRFGDCFKFDKLDAKHYRHEFNINKLKPDFVDHIMGKINAIRGFKNANASCIKSVNIYRERDKTGKNILRGCIRFENKSGKSDMLIIH